jgi:hypothetical protein
MGGLGRSVPVAKSFLYLEKDAENQRLQWLKAVDLQSFLAFSSSLGHKFALSFYSCQAPPCAESNPAAVDKT